MGKGGTGNMNWQQMGGLALGPAAAPKKQTLSSQFNVSNRDGKLLKSVAETVQVSCRTIQVNAPAAGNGEMTVTPVN